MADLEIIERCAQAMGLDAMAIEQSLFDYDPLHNDEQAMALVRKMRLRIVPTITCSARGKRKTWHVEYCADEAAYSCDSNADLNRAICECVANLAAQPPAQGGGSEFTINQEKP